MFAPAGDEPGFSNTSWLNYRDIRDQSRSFQTLGLYAIDVTVVESKDGSLSVSAPRVTPNIFSMLGTKPLLGALSRSGRSTGRPTRGHSFRGALAAKL